MKENTELHEEMTNESGGNPLAKGLIGSRFVELERVSREIAGTVYRAKDKLHLNRSVSLRELDFSTGNTNRMWSVFNEYLKKLATFNHEGLPSILFHFMEKKKAYIVSKWLEGENLERIPERYRGKITPFDVAFWMRSTAGVLSYLHRKTPPVIHGNIKPSGIISPSPGKVVLLHFSLDHVLGTRLGEARYSHPEFESPEHFTGHPDTRSDIYSLSAVGYYLFTGKHPREFPPFCLPPVQEILPQLPDSMAMIIEKGLKYDPDARYQSIDELLADLNRCLDAIPSRSVYADQYNCPNCRNVLIRNELLCPECGIDQGIYQGHADAVDYFNRGINRFNKGETVLADRHFFQAMRLHLDEPEVYINIARCRDMEGCTDSALRMLESIERRFPEHPGALLESLKICRRLGLAEDEEKIRQKLEERFSGHPALLMEKAGELMEKDAPGDALKIVDEILHKDSSNPEAVLLKTEALTRLDDGEKLEEFIGSLEQKEVTGRMYNLLDLHLEKKGDGEGSSWVSVKASGKDPYNPDYLLRTARAFARMGDVKFAPENYRKVIALRPGDLEIQEELIRFLVEKGLMDEALPYVYFYRLKSPEKKFEIITGESGIKTGQKETKDNNELSFALEPAGSLILLGGLEEILKLLEKADLIGRENRIGKLSLLEDLKRLNEKYCDEEEFPVPMDEAGEDFEED